MKPKTLVHVADLLSDSACVLTGHLCVYRVFSRVQGWDLDGVPWLPEHDPGWPFPGPEPSGLQCKHTCLSACLAQGLLPDVACNKRAYSARFGGRCAAPVVQYLAYDEAYHLPATAAKYGLPEYGGCLAGGLMRFLGTGIMTDFSTWSGDWTAYSSWWTPPFWPVDAWYNLLETRPGSTYAERVAARDAFLNDQEKLNSLFVYQEQFRVTPRTKGPAGEACVDCRAILGDSSAHMHLLPLGPISSQCSDCSNACLQYCRTDRLHTVPVSVLGQ